MDSNLFKRQLIEAVQNHPCIWNTKLSAFRDAKLKEESWTEIAVSLQQPVKACQDVYRHLRDTFVKKRSAAAENPDLLLGRNKWEFFDMMIFLDEFCRARKKRRGGSEFLALPVRQSGSSYLFTARNEFKMNLIEEVRCFENLWNPSVPDYHDEELRVDCWNEIARKLRTNDKECRTTFKVLRDAYVQIYSKQDRSNWEFSEALSFLDTVDTARQSTSNSTAEHAIECVSIESNSDTDEHTSETFAPKIVSTSTVDMSVFNGASSSRKRNRTVEPEETLQNMNFSHVIINDELDIFGTAVVLKLRRMDSSVRDDVIFKIETVLHQGLQQSASIKEKS